MLRLFEVTQETVFREHANLKPSLERALRSIAGLESFADRRRFLRALRYSTQGDGGQPPKIFGPEEISRYTGASPAILYDYGILLDRQRASSFLWSLNLKVSPQKLQKQLSASSHKAVLGRSPTKVRNSYVFTYLEVLQIAGGTFRIELPHEL